MLKIHENWTADLMKVSPGERTLRPLTRGLTKVWRHQHVWNVLPLSRTRSTWPLHWPRVHHKEMILIRWIKNYGFERVLCLVCICWWANRGLSFKTQRCGCGCVCVRSFEDELHKLLRTWSPGRLGLPHGFLVRVRSWRAMSAAEKTRRSPWIPRKVQNQ